MLALLTEALKTGVITVIIVQNSQYKIKMDLKAHAFVVLEKAGIKRGKTVLVFGCGSGTHTIPAAKIVGKEEIESVNFLS